MNITFRGNVKIKATQTSIVAGTKATGKFIKVPSSVVPGLMRDAIEVTIAEGTEVAPGYVLEDDVVLKTAQFTMFFAPPSVKTMEKWSDTGIAKSVTGKKVEVDGYGPDGSPSWMVAMGMV